MSIELGITLIICFYFTILSPCAISTSNFQSALMFKIIPALLGLAAVWTQRDDLLNFLS